MLPTCSRITAAVTLLLASGASAQEPIDLLAGVYRFGLHVSAYNPRVEPQVRCIRSNDEATLFCAAAWDEEHEALHIDFEREQILVVAWGALRFHEPSQGALTAIHLEHATIADGTLRVTLRTVIPPGPGLDVALDQSGRTWYPSLFVRTPRTERVEVDLIGARRRNPASDFRPLATKELEVRIAPDAAPARELVTLTDRRETAAAEKPAICLGARGAQQVLEIAWGKLGAGAYHLDLVGARIEQGTAHLTVRANNRLIFVYSGPGEHTPGLALNLPAVDKVLLHIERVGIPLAAGEPDFEGQSDEQLTVTVDRSAVRSPR